MNKKEKNVISFLSEDEKEKYNSLSEVQKKRLQYMGENETHSYIAKCYAETHRETPKDLRESMIASIKDADSVLSTRISEEELDSKQFACKFCGEKFKTEEAKDKHQKICM